MGQLIWTSSTVQSAVTKLNKNLKKKMMNNILVTGGCGFIGGHLVESINKTYPSAKIVVVDDLRTPGEHFVDSPNVKYIYESIQDSSVVQQLKVNYSFDTIFHLANTPRVRRAIEFPAETIDNNVTSTTAVCEIGLQHGSHVFFSQSSSIQYNDQGTMENAYTLSKSFADQILAMYMHQYGLQVTNMYYYSVYGPREADYGVYSTVIRRFKQKINSNDSLEIYGDGSKKRDFTHVSDVVNNMMLMVEDKDVKEGKISNVHFGRGHPTSIKELADAFDWPIVYKFDIPGEAQTTHCVKPYGEYEHNVIKYVKSWREKNGNNV